MPTATARQPHPCGCRTYVADWALDVPTAAAGCDACAGNVESPAQNPSGRQEARAPSSETVLVAPEGTVASSDRKRCS